MGIFDFKNKSESVLVFDIGSSSVGGAFFKTQKNGIPEISLSIREPISFEKQIEPEKFIFLALKSLELVASRICLMGIGAPDKIFCVLTSPWYASETRVIKLKKETAFVFNRKLADELIQKEIELIKKEKNNYIRSGEESRLLEFKNMKTVLNGYEVEDPLDQKAEEVEMTFFCSFSSEKVLKRIEEKINRHFHIPDIKFATFVMASYLAVRDILVQQKDFLLIDICGEITDISLVKKNVLSSSISYPLGRNFIIRGVAEEFNCSLDEAKSYLTLFKDDHASESEKKKFGPTINRLRDEWLKKFQESLISLSSDISIPHTVFVTVDPDLVDFFSEAIKTERFNQFTLTEAQFKIIFLNTQMLHGAATFTEHINNRDPFLIIVSIYLNRFLC